MIRCESLDKVQPALGRAADLRGELLGFGGVLRDFDAACLAASAHQHLGFNNNAATEFLGDLSRRFCGSRYPSLGDRNSIFGKDQFGLVLVEFHDFSRGICIC